MSQPRKPIPKSQRTVSIESQDPFQGKEGRGAQQNPNSADSRQNSPANYQSTGIKFNRSEQMTFKGDTTKQYSVGIKDIDEAVFYYFNNEIKPMVYQNGERIEVPIIYGSPERWKSFQRDGYYRDKNGAIMYPIIVVKRDTLAKDRTVANKLDSNQPNLYGVYFNRHFVCNHTKSRSSYHNEKHRKCQNLRIECVTSLCSCCIVV